MAENYDITNLTLDSNEFITAKPGDYHFMVVSHEVDYYSGPSEKIPQGTQVVIAYLEVPFFDDEGKLQVATVRNNLNIYKKAMFAVRQFVEAIGLVGEKGRASINLEDMDGHSGICSLICNVSANGNEYNRVDEVFPPSKAPTVTDNDDAWEKYLENRKKNAFVPVSDSDDMPF